MINKQRGFTLLETLVAITIVTLTIIGPLAMASQASRLIGVAKNQLVANYLAQEAIEIVRQERDTNMIMANVNTNPDVTIDWLVGDLENPGNLLGCISDTQAESCYIDSGFNPPKFHSCSGPDSGCKDARSNMVLTANDGYRPAISNAGGKQTSFRRFIQIAPITINGEQNSAKVIVKIMWTDIYGVKTLYVQENIYKYR